MCKTAPVPGETKVWQYITLMKRIFLIDCPGVVYNRTADKEEESDTVLRLCVLWSVMMWYERGGVRMCKVFQGSSNVVTVIASQNPFHEQHWRPANPSC